MEQTLLLAPLAGAIIAGLGWRLIGETASRWSAMALILISAALSWLVTLSASNVSDVRYLHTWVESGSFSAALAFRLDRDFASLLVLVTSLSAVLHAIALTRVTGASSDKKPANTTMPGLEARLCAGLSFMTFSVILLIVADDMVQFLAGWILTGFASYLLVGLVTRRPSSGKAAVRAVMTLRAGEAALLLALGALFALTDSIRFDDVFLTLADQPETALQFGPFGGPASEWIAAGIVLASLIMAAQAIFFGWFSEASEAPLPAAVSILTVGPAIVASILLLRMGPLLDLAPLMSWCLTVAAMAGAVIASTSAIAQKDPIRVIACLASAQAGFVLAALGLGAAEAAQQHLLSSMVALAALALAVGLSSGQIGAAKDLDRLGALRRAAPLLLAAAVLSALSLAAFGVPGTQIGLSGYSTYVTIFDVFATEPSQQVFWAGIVALGFCSLGAWRLVLRVFEFPPRAVSADGEPVPAGRLVSSLVFVLAAIGVSPIVIASGSVSEVHAVPIVIAGVLGFALAWLAAIGGGSVSQKLRDAVPWASNVLLNGWYMATLLRLLVTSPLNWAMGALSQEPKNGEPQNSLTGALKLAPVLAQQASRLQGGLLAGYGVAMVIGVVVLVLWIVLLGGGS